jgi:hypothetical protein
MTTHDPEFYQAPKFTPEQHEVRSGHGCFFYGCIIASILALLMVVAIGVAAYLGYRFLNKLVDDWTSTTARQLPTVEMPAEERQALKDRVEAFRKAVDAGNATEPLILTSKDLNALIEEEPDLKGKIYVDIAGDKVKGQISIPLEAIGLGMVKGRYLNGEADLKASLRDGVLIVTLDSFEVNGKRPPEELLANLRQQNLAKDVYKNPKQAEMLRKVESLEIKDGKIIIALRRAGSESSTEKSPEKSSPAGDAKTVAPERPASEPARNGQPPDAKALTPPANSPVPKT